MELKSIVNWLNRALPHNCLLCHQSADALLCHTCKDDLPLYDLPAEQFDLMRNPGIAKHLPAMQVERLCCLSSYQWPFDMWLSGLKFKRHQLPVTVMTALFAEQLREHPKLPEVIVPVPLHYRRYLLRHFNQSLLLATALSRIIGVPVASDYLSRQRATAAQTHLSGAQRRRNLKKAFTLHRPLPHSHIALLDDVITTGSTLAELVKTLQSQQPDLRIELWAFAISLKQ